MSTSRGVRIVPPLNFLKRGGTKLKIEIYQYQRHKSKLLLNMVIHKNILKQGKHTFRFSDCVSWEKIPCPKR
jgi:hypothetical protein